ncbi:16S rRNA (uracil(1498)-N(3))-methyltransferase [Candidatus Gracilibacteria bacterium]|nr:16S rRNA (uracil(1498)-N(3))-methyltransferase [Candidatus Gracilibacteria bacterium]
MQHFFTKIEFLSDEKFGKITEKSIINQFTKILRGKIGDKIFVLDGKGGKFLCEIIGIEKKFFEIKILEKIFLDKEKFFSDDKNFGGNKKINLFFALPKSKEKFEFILQKGTELGVCEFHPFFSDFCNAKYPNKIERNNLIIKEASEQSERFFLPKLKDFNKFEKIFDEKEKFYFFDSRGENLKSQFDIIKNGGYPQEINLIIGPEGGFSEKEVQTAKEKNCEFLTLGTNILRLETAIICAISRIL